MSDGLDDDRVGQRLLGGKLEVLRRLGEGGMGAVYEVLHHGTRHRRALKVLHPDLASRDDVVARFLREATVAGTLGSPHVVETFDAGRLEDGSPYVLMELLEGRTLADALDEGLGSERLCAIVAEAATGLAQAHAAGIVHRDVKPDNVFLARTESGERVKLLDFGISKFAIAHDVHGTLTQDGAMMGTPHYMAPEQAEGARDVDLRVDVYALGVVLYEGLTGRPPYVADSLPALVIRIHEGEHVPVDTLAPDLPEGLAGVVERAMHRDPEERFATATELARALAPFTGRLSHAPEAFGATIATDAIATPRRPGRWRVALAIGAALALVGAVAAWGLAPPSGARTEVSEGAARSEGGRAPSVPAARPDAGALAAPVAPPSEGEALPGEALPAPAAPTEGTGARRRGPRIDRRNPF